MRFTVLLKRLALKVERNEGGRRFWRIGEVMACTEYWFMFWYFVTILKIFLQNNVEIRLSC